MKKVVFYLKPHSIIDVITNSSSELFVGTGSNKEDLEKAITYFYPNYLDEYKNLCSIDELSIQDLEVFFSYYCSPGIWPARKDDYPIIPGFTFDELYEPQEHTYSEKIPVQYRLKNNKKEKNTKWDRSFVTSENFEEIKNKLDPKREMFFLFSHDKNPNWEMQEKLESIMVRIHLG